MSRKKGSPLDTLQKRNLPKLTEAAVKNKPAAQSYSSTAVEEEAKVPMRSSNVTLPVSAWNWIDDRHREIQRSGWHSVTKAAIFRSVLAVVMSAQIDLSGATSEEEIAQRFHRAMAQPPN